MNKLLFVFFLLKVLIDTAHVPTEFLIYSKQIVSSSENLKTQKNFLRFGNHCKKCIVYHMSGVDTTHRSVSATGLKLSLTIN